MYSVSTNFLTKIVQPSRTFNMKVEIGNPVSYTLTNEDVINWEIESSLGNSNMPGIGGVVSSTFKLKILKTANVPATWGVQQIKPYIGIDGEYIPLGVFYMDNTTMTKDDFSIEFTCYDGLRKFENMEYYTTTTYPAPLRNVATELQNYGIGITFENINQLPNVICHVAPKGTIRNVLGEFAELAGGNCVMTRTGLVSFRNLTNTNFITETLNADNYFEFKLGADEKITIDRLICKKADETQSLSYGAGTGATLTFENDNIVDAYDLQIVYNSCYPLSYYSYTLKAQGMPHLDGGDMFLLTTYKGTQYELFVMTHKLTYNGGLVSEFTVGTPQTDIQQTGSTSANSLTQTVGILRTNQIEADRIYTDRFEAVEGYVENLETKVLTADKAHLSFANIDTATIANGVISNAMIADAAITNAKIDRATANKLTIVSADIADAAITNAKIDRATVNKLVVESTDIKDAAITTAKIGDAQITSAKINDVSADKLTAGTIDALDINVVNLNAANITVGTINGTQITNGAIDATKLETTLNGKITTSYDEITSTPPSWTQSPTIPTFTDIVSGTFVSNTFTRNASSGWNAGFKSVETFTNGQYIECAVTTLTTSYMFGFNNGTNDANYTSIDFAVYQNNSTLRFYSNGSHKANIGTVIVGDKIRLAIYNSIIFVFKNNELLYSSAIVPTLPLYIDASVKAANATITGIVYGTYTHPTLKYLSDTAVKNASMAEEYARSAQGSADTANTNISNIVNDNIFSATEKQSIRKEWDALYGDYSSLYNQGTTFELTTERDAYAAAINALGTYLNGGTAYTISATVPSWINNTNLATNTTIVGTTFRSTFATFYTARQVYLNAIANKARVLANTAQATAETKNSVFYQASAPTGGTYKVNDIWFDTDDGNSIYSWNGTSWVLKQFGTNALAQNSITTELVAAGCISADKIANGTIDNSKIALGAIAADKLNIATHFLC